MVPVTTSAPAPVDVHMPSAVAITGYVYGPNGTPALANIGVNANSNTYGTGTQTDINGYYSLAVPPNGAYTLQFNDNSPTPIYLNGCYIDSPTANFTTDQGACDQVQVNAVDVGPINVSMPLGVHISGYVYGPNGTPALANIGVNANSNTNGAGAQTDINGYYSVAVPSGSYTLQFNDNSPTPIYLNGCYIDSPTANFTTDHGACDQVQVNAVDVGPINVSMPSAVHITGTVYGPGGSTGLVGIHVNANAGNLGFGAQTDINGYYSLTVPSGSYTLQFNDSTGRHLSGCYDSNNSPSYFTTNQQNLCTPVQVEGSNVPGKDVWMPDGVAISGTVTGPGGTPALTNVWVGTNGAGTQTDINGYYSLAVPPNGAYTTPFNANSGTHASGCYDSNNSPSYFTTNQPNGCTPVDVITSDVGPINVLMPLATTIIWFNPAPIIYGAPLSGTQLNATASVPGVLAYTPAAGTVLGGGGSQVLSVHFTPTDHDYAEATATVFIDATSPDTVITGSAPAAITYGTPLSTAQLNATASAGGTLIDGTFDYTPTAGTVLGAGAHQALDVLFTPSDHNYGGGHATVYIDVDPAPLTVSVIGRKSVA